MRLRVAHEYLGDLIGAIASAGGRITGSTEEHHALIVQAWFESPDAAAALREALVDRRLAGRVEIVDP